MENLLPRSFSSSMYGLTRNSRSTGAKKPPCNTGSMLEFDIKGLFDNIDHDLLMKAVKWHAKDKWVLLYIKRWPTALMSRDGEEIPRNKGTPQAGVISPVASNLFLHYAFDLWMTRRFPRAPFARYADDGVVHCCSKQEAEEVKLYLEKRLAA